MAFTSNSAHGKKFQKLLYEEMLLLAGNGKLSDVELNFGVRHPGYSSPSQYYAPILIVFKTGVKWVLFTTTACRTDRIKGQQWDAEHLKLLCPNIERACLVYPDDVAGKDKEAFLSQQRKYENKWEYTCIDTIESMKELITEIENV